MFDVVIFFNGPRTQWSGKVLDDDIISRAPVRFRWLARLHARSLLKQLNTGRCGYVITKDGAVVDEVMPS